MTRKECERRLIRLAEQADAIYRAYNPTGDGIMISTHRDGYISVSDIDVKQDPDNPDKSVIVNWTIEGVKNGDEIYTNWMDGMTVRPEEDENE